MATTKTQHQAFTEAIEKDLVALMEGTAEPAELKKHFKPIEGLLKTLKLDESLMTALPGTCMKKADARGPFDQMVIQALEKNLKEKFDELEKLIADEAPAAKERSDAVEAASQVVNKARETQTGVVNEVREAEKEESDAKEAVRAAQQGLDDYEPVQSPP